MKKYIKSSDNGKHDDDWYLMNGFFDTQYSYYGKGHTEQDKEYFKNKYTKAGKHGVRVRRVKTDTPGLPMYEITWESEDSTGVPDYIWYTGY